MQIYPRNTTHSAEHYLRVLLTFSSGLSAGLTHRDIAQCLNDAGIRSSTGISWTTQAVKSALKKLRSKTGPIYRAMLELHFASRLTNIQCRPLLQTL